MKMKMKIFLKRLDQHGSQGFSGDVPNYSCILLYYLSCVIPMDKRERLKKKTYLVKNL